MRFVIIIITEWAGNKTFSSIHPYRRALFFSSFLKGEMSDKSRKVPLPFFVHWTWALQGTCCWHSTHFEWQKLIMWKRERDRRGGCLNALSLDISITPLLGSKVIRSQRDSFLFNFIFSDVVLIRSSDSGKSSRSQFQCRKLYKKKHNDSGRPILQKKNLGPTRWRMRKHLIIGCLCCAYAVIRLVGGSRQTSLHALIYCQKQRPCITLHSLGEFLSKKKTCTMSGGSFFLCCRKTTDRNARVWPINQNRKWKNLRRKRQQQHYGPTMQFCQKKKFWENLISPSHCCCFVSRQVMRK